MKTQLFLWAIFLSSGLHSQSCNIDGVNYFDYADIVQIFNSNNCNSCHNPAGSAPEWQYGSYDDIISFDQCGDEIIVHGNASKSALYDKLNGGTAACGDAMPVDRQPLSKQELYAVESWINSGATEKCIPLYPEIKDLLTQSNCGTCHTANSSWGFQSYDHILGYQNGTLCDEPVVPYSAEESVLYQLVSNEIEYCDNIPIHERLPEEALLVLRDWINAGALEGSASLPVELEDFDLELINPDRDVLLNWTSVLEIGTDKYIIERSTDGRIFDQISEVKAVGSSTSTLHYSYTDSDPFLGLAYYRLRITDFDGSFSYSHIISVRKEPLADVLTLNPTLTTGESSINLSWYTRIDRPEANAYLVNASGQSIMKVRIIEGENVLQLPQLDNGLYYIVVHDFFDSYQLGRFMVVN